MSVKILDIAELKKMSEKDRAKVLTDSTRELAHVKLHVRSQEDKRSHQITALKRQIARIHTLNNSKPSTDEK